MFLMAWLGGTVLLLGVEVRVQPSSPYALHCKAYEESDDVEREACLAAADGVARWSPTRHASGVTTLCQDVSKCAVCLRCGASKLCERRMLD